MFRDVGPFALRDVLDPMSHHRINGRFFIVQTEINVPLENLDLERIWQKKAAVSNNVDQAAQLQACGFIKANNATFYTIKVGLYFIL